MPKASSPLTGLEVKCDRTALTDTSYYDDPACGEYAVGFDANLSALSQAEKHRIGKVLATRKLRSGSSLILLTSERTGEHESWHCTPTDSLLSQYPNDVVSVLDEALVNLSEMVEFPSDKIEITEVTRWNIFAHDHDSEDYVIRQLSDMGFIKNAGSRSGGTYMIQSFTIEANGWARLQELQKDATQSDQAFVAMWFDDKMQSIYDDGIEPAIRDAGFRPLRIDFKDHNNKICDEIIAEVRRSRFIVADFSGNRGGVYYEAGFAHGLGRSVIWTVQKEYLDDVHFDTRQYNHIVYESAEELRERLFQRIRATQK